MISLVPNELCKFNFTSAEFYLHRDTEVFRLVEGMDRVANHSCVHN